MTIHAPSRPPRAELHVHIEGTLEPDLAFELAARHGVVLPYPDPTALRAAYEFEDLPSFLQLYTANMAVLRTEADFADLTRAYLTRAVAAQRQLLSRAGPAAANASW